MHYLKIYADEAGESHFVEQDISALLEWTGRVTRLVRVAPGHTSPLHPEPAPTLATALCGSVTISTSDGVARRLEPGTVMLFLDTSGRGHSFANGEEEACLMIHRLADPTPRSSPTGP